MTGQLSIRAKLALWYLAVTSTALLLFGLLSYGTLRFTLLQLKEASLIRREQRLNLYLEQNRESGTSTSIPEQLRSYSVIAHEGNLFQIRDLNGSLAFPLDQETAELLPHPPSDCRKPVFRDTDIDGNPAMILCHQATLDGHRYDSISEDRSKKTRLSSTGIGMRSCCFSLVCSGSQA